MKVLHSLEAVDPPLAQSILTIGNFDGVHRAHQQIIAQAGLYAANTGGPVVVLTFAPHPMRIIAPERAPATLQTQDEKTACLGQAGADVVVIARSEPSLFGIPAAQFVDEVIRRRFHPTHIVEGPSFGFGRGRQGTPEMLMELAATFGCKVHIVEPVNVELDDGRSQMVSSSLIRKLIREGKVHCAALCLGRPFTLSGKVVEGDRRGRSIGFPTLNLEVPEEMILPGDGVYAGQTVVDDRRLMCAISIGVRPTFGTCAHALEVHLIDFDGDLYGSTVGITFDHRLRAQKAFDSAASLRAQLERDVTAIRQLYANSCETLQAKDNQAT